jgi:hypothetical protein
MTRRELLGLGATALTGAIAGCGGGSQPEPPPQTTSPTAGEDATKKMMGMGGIPAEKAKTK